MHSESGSPRPVRSDVRRNRAALLQAGRELFATGQDVPMYEVARRAGVGQATLYRHFPDRGALAAELAEELMTELEALADSLTGDPDALATLLQHAVQTSARSLALTRAVREGASSDTALAGYRRRYLDMFGSVLRAARTAGAVRPGCTAADVLLAVQMVQGGMEVVSPEPQAAPKLAANLLRLVMTGLIPDRPRMPAKTGQGTTTARPRTKPARSRSQPETA